MICTTIQNRNAEQILEILQDCEMAEIRLDRCPLTAKEIDDIFSSDVPLVATCRISEIAETDPSLREVPEQSRMIRAMQIAEKKLIRAIEAGARYVDVEMEAQKQMSKRVRYAAHENGTVFIRSYHDFEGTGTVEELRAMAEKCLYHGADLVKLVTAAGSQEDVERVMSLYGWCSAEKAAGNGRVGALADGGLIAFCMGEAGRQSRIDCLRHGAPYTYAALNADEAAAPGQWPAAEMHEAIYAKYGFVGKPCEILKKSGESGTDLPENRVRPIRMPASKSFAQRAIIAAALAEGTSHLRGYTPCGDNEAALQVARRLGAEVSVDDNVLTIRGIAAQAGCLGQILDLEGNPVTDDEGHPVLHVGESGLLTRMMIPVMSQICTESVTFTGEKTLLGRPLTGAVEIMEAFGASMVSLADTSSDSLAAGTVPQSAGTVTDIARTDKDTAGPTATAAKAPTARIPLKVTGPLRPGRVEISGKHGSQLISGLLMALPFNEKNSTLSVNDPKSIPYMFITLEVLKKFGIRTGNEMLGGRDFLESDGDWSLCTEIVFKIKGGQKYKAVDMDLEGDWSAAANFLVAGALFGRLEIEALDTTSLQADLSIMDILMDAGASLSQLDGDRGTVAVQRAPLKAFKTDASNCPDLFPIIAVLSAFCQGTSRLAGVGRLANKESDRAKAISQMLTQMGVKIGIEGDEMVIEGHSLTQRLLNGNLLKGGSYTSCHDHRMVMALKVASLGADSPVIIDDEECVSKSFPRFHEIFTSVIRTERSEKGK